MQRHEYAAWRRSIGTCVEIRTLSAAKRPCASERSSAFAFTSRPDVDSPFRPVSSCPRIRGIGKLLPGLRGETRRKSQGCLTMHDSRPRSLIGILLLILFFLAAPHLGVAQET